MIDGIWLRAGAAREAVDDRASTQLQIGLPAPRESTAGMPRTGSATTRIAGERSRRCRAAALSGAPRAATAARVAERDNDDRGRHYRDGGGGASEELAADRIERLERTVEALAERVVESESGNEELRSKLAELRAEVEFLKNAVVAADGETGRTSHERGRRAVTVRGPIATGAIVVVFAVAVLALASGSVAAADPVRGVDAPSMAVGDSGSESATFEHTFDDGGERTVTVAGASAGSVEVPEQSSEEDDGGSGSGGDGGSPLALLAGLFVLLAVGGIGGYFWHDPEAVEELLNR